MSRRQAFKLQQRQAEDDDLPLPHSRSYSSVSEALPGTAAGRVFAHTTSGVVFGALVLVAAVVSIAILNVWHDDVPGNVHAAVLTAQIVDLALYIMSLVVVCAGFVALHRDLHLQSGGHGTETAVDTILVWTSACGPTLYHALSALADWYMREDAVYNWQLDFTINILGAVQTCAQTLFILDAIRRRRLVGDTAALSSRFMSAKHVMAFLTFFNLSLLLVMTFRHQQPDFKPLQTQFYSKSVWTTIIRGCLPAAIFYRFTCTIISLNLWRRVFSKKIKGQ